MTAQPDKDTTKSADSSTREMPASDHTVIIEVPRELGCYRLTKMLGRGGMGEVWQAFDTHLERDVAIKLMRKELLSNEDATRRFAREARAVARLNHPNIVHVYAFGDEKGLTYFAMEMVEGETVTQRLKRTGKFPLSDALQITMQAIEGLGYANARGIIHRDIKPSNLMLTEASHVKIADFGLAKMVEHDTQMTAAGTAMGSPNYMSPEQARGEEADHRSDIYALGISLYQMLCDCLPFTAHSPVSVLLKQIQDPLPEPEELKNLHNGAVMAVLKKMTEKTPGLRYQSYGELTAAIAALQPDLMYKGAHGITASMPVANTTTAEAMEPGGPTADAVLLSGSPISPPPPPPADTLSRTPTGHGTAVVSSRNAPHDDSDNHSSTGKKPWLIPALIVLAIALSAISVAWYLFSINENDKTSPAQTASVAPQVARPAQIPTQQITPATAQTNSPATLISIQPQPSPTPASIASPASTGSVAGPTPDPQTGMQPINVTAVVTPRLTPFPGVLTTITPVPKLAELMPTSLRQTSKKPATPPAPVIFTLGTDGAGPTEKIPTYIDPAGRNPHKAFPAGTEVTYISATATMIRATAPDGRLVYIHKKMLTQKP